MRTSSRSPRPSSPSTARKKSGTVTLIAWTSGAPTGRVQPPAPPRQGAGVVDLIDGLQLLLQRREGGRLRLLLVHAGGVEIPDLLREGISRVRLSAGVPLEDVAQSRFVALEHLAEGAAPARAVLGDGRPREPASAGELVEVLAGVHRAVEGGEVDPRGGSLRSRGGGG